jgi:hypothetical protein
MQREIWAEINAVRDKSLPMTQRAIALEELTPDELLRRKIDPRVSRALSIFQRFEQGLITTDEEAARALRHL